MTTSYKLYFNGSPVLARKCSTPEEAWAEAVSRSKTLDTDIDTYEVRKVVETPLKRVTKTFFEEIN